MEITEETLAIIDEIVSKLARRYRFGYHDLEDMKQEGRLLALNLLRQDVYDGVRPLRNFLFTHLRNRLSNFKRDNYRRNDAPCKTCQVAEERGEASQCDKAVSAGTPFCKRYSSWNIRNSRKQQLMAAGLCHELSGQEPSGHFNHCSNLETEELYEIILSELSTDMCDIFLRILNGDYVTRNKRNKLQEEIKRIFKENGAAEQDG